jgi:hypothetical protein
VGNIDSFFIDYDVNFNDEKKLVKTGNIKLNIYLLTHEELNVNFIKSSLEENKHDLYHFMSDLRAIKKSNFFYILYDSEKKPIIKEFYSSILLEKEE